MPDAKELIPLTRRHSSFYQIGIISLTQHHNPLKLSKSERADRNTVLAHEKSIYDSPIKTIPMKPLTKSVATFDTPEEKKQAAKALRVAAGGVPESANPKRERKKLRENGRN